VQYVLYIVIGINWMSCALYMTACPPVLLTDEHLATMTSAAGQHCVENSWLIKSMQANSTDRELYSTSAYFAIVTFMTVGFGDYSARNTYEVRICQLLSSFLPTAIGGMHPIAMNLAITRYEQTIFVLFIASSEMLTKPKM